MAIVQDILAVKGDQVVAASPADTVLEVARRMTEARVGAVVVCDGLRCVGIFTERDLMRRVVCQGRHPEATPVSEVMSSPVACCVPETTIEECRAVMTAQRLRHLPVVAEGRLCGIVSIGDLVAREVQMQQTTIEYLSGYLLGRV